MDNGVQMLLGADINVSQTNPEPHAILDTRGQVPAVFPWGPKYAVTVAIAIRDNAAGKLMEIFSAYLNNTRTQASTLIIW